MDGYTTEEPWNLLKEFITASPFSWLEDPKITAKVHKLLDSSRADQRLSKLLSAGDDLGSMAYIVGSSQRRSGSLNSVIHDGSNYYTSFVLAVTQGVGGQMKRITVVDRFIYHDQHITCSIFNSMQGANDGIDVRLLTSGIPYQRMSEDFSEEEVQRNTGKVKPHCDECCSWNLPAGQEHLTIDISSLNPPLKTDSLKGPTPCSKAREKSDSA